MSALQLTIYVNESDRHEDMPLHEFLVRRLLRLHIAGATVLRGAMGFGHDGMMYVTSGDGTSDREVEKGSPSEGFGLKAGDVVSELARISVRDTSDLRARIGLLRVGDVADLTVVRNGKPMVIRATISD